MSGHGWDPERYLAFADERSRPFADLLARVGATQARRVVDLGCGPGNLTRRLKRRWPEADVLGLDSSPAMVGAARREAARDGAARGEAAAGEAAAEVRFEVADLRDWRAERPVDVLVSNATLQWVPGHLDLLPRLAAQVAPGGWLAIQVPGNFTAPSHRLLAELAAEERFAPYVAHTTRPDAHGPGAYLEALLDLGCRAEAWETTYLHLLQGEDPVFTWVSGTGARPVLQALPDGLREEFETSYKRLLRAAYPPGPHGTMLPFRRVFAVAQMPEDHQAAAE